MNPSSLNKNKRLEEMSKSETIEMSKSETIEWFQDFKHMSIYQRIALFHKLGLRKHWWNQNDAVEIMGLRSRSSLAHFDSLKNMLSSHCSWPDILEAWSEGSLRDEISRKKLDFTTLREKVVKERRQIECVYQDGGSWYLRWKEESQA